jgi:hypothetical protein
MTNGQSRETINIGYTRRRKTKQIKVMIIVDKAPPIHVSIIKVRVLLLYA